MIKNLKFAAIAMVAMALTVACNNSNNNEDTTAPAEDTVTVDTIAVEDTTPVVDTIVPEQPVQKKATTDKKADKKELKATTTTPAKDVKTNAQNRLERQAVENADLKEASTTKGGPVVDPKKNAENRLKR